MEFILQQKGLIDTDNIGLFAVQNCKLNRSQATLSTEVATKHGKVLQIVKMDGKILQFSSPILVKDMLVNFSGSDNMSSIADKEKDNGVRRIKIVITKKQLQELLAKQASAEDVLSGLEKKTCNNAFDSRTNWKPKLESISEGSE
ncbi:hypothetical protein CMV_012705 [Castanea mollissima]|uniref:Uncharacterized protein n=1 Tax=Castanea mollissima TaxID=60419 RepID=A0A8J4QZG7_9ROSI|nr:hypothetical protein CMV_012705 [Castanea mollissima]